MKLKDESAELIMKYLSLIKMNTKNKDIIELAERCHTLISLPFIADQLKQMANEDKAEEDLQQENERLKEQLAKKDKEIEELKEYRKGAYEKYVSKCAYLQQQLKDTYKQACNEIRQKLQPLVNTSINEGQVALIKQIIKEVEDGK